MAADDQFYIAWDGRRYAGSPPPGWYLAADNRWWPSQDMIDRGDASTPDGDEPTWSADPQPPSRTAGDEPTGSADPQPPSRTAGGGPPLRGGPPDPPGTTEASTAPHQSWAPAPAAITGQPWAPDIPAPPPPVGGPVAQPTQQPGTSKPSSPSIRRSSRRSGRRGFPSGIFLAFLVFSLFRCGAGAFGDDGPQSFDTVPSLTLEPVETTGGPVAADSSSTTGAASDEWGFVSEVAIAEIDSCGPRIVAGNVIGLDGTGAALEVIISVVSSGPEGGDEAELDTIVDQPESGVSTGWLIVAPTDLGTILECSIAEVNPVTRGGS